MARKQSTRQSSPASEPQLTEEQYEAMSENKPTRVSTKSALILEPEFLADFVKPQRTRETGTKEAYAQLIAMLRRNPGQWAKVAQGLKSPAPLVKFLKTEGCDTHAKNGEVFASYQG